MDVHARGHRSVANSYSSYSTLVMPNMQRLPVVYSSVVLHSCGPGGKDERAKSKSKITPRTPVICIDHSRLICMTEPQFPELVTLRSCQIEAVRRRSHRLRDYRRLGSALSLARSRSACSTCSAALSRSMRMRAASVPSSSTSSSNHGCFSASRAVIRFLGSYTKIFRNRSKNKRLNSFVGGMISSRRFMPRTNLRDWRGVSG